MVQPITTEKSVLDMDMLVLAAVVDWVQELRFDWFRGGAPTNGGRGRLFRQTTIPSVSKQTKCSRFVAKLEHRRRPRNHAEFLDHCSLLFLMVR